MVLSGANLIEINATVIVGLLILLTFQVLGTISIGDDITKLRKQQNDIAVEMSTIHLVGTQRCNSFESAKFDEGTHCHDWQKQYVYLIAKDHSIDKRIDTLRLVQKNIKIEPLALIMIVGDILSNFLLVPFAVSAVIETIKSSKREGLDNPASELGIKIMIFGFILLAAGISYDAVFKSIGQIFY